VVRYEFREGTGDTITGLSKTGEPLNLRVKDASVVKWLDGGGLQIGKATLIASTQPAAKLVEAVKQSRAITIEAWIKPANITQAGPARIVTLSKDTSSRNFTLGQKAGAYEVRLRTTTTSANGEPSLSSPGGDETSPSVVGLRSPEGDLAVLYFSAGGKKSEPDMLDTLPGRKWFNPRRVNGRLADDDREGTSSPDEQD
jgi:hypothetical protein